MSGNASKSYPGLAGGIELVTGELVVDTGLIEVAHFQATLAQDPDTGAGDAAAVSASLDPQVAGATRKLRLACWQDDFSAATVAAYVSWSAHQD